jgi:hypothetical protein
MSTIFERLEKKLDNMEKKVEKRVEKKIMHQRITEMVRGMNIWEKLELHIKIGI